MSSEVDLRAFDAEAMGREARRRLQLFNSESRRADALSTPATEVVGGHSNCRAHAKHVSARIRPPVTVPASEQSEGNPSSETSLAPPL